MKILIAGASGFIGNYLIRAFIEKGYSVTGLSRSPQKQLQSKSLSWKKWQNNDFSDWLADFESSDVVINLMGESLAGKRWSNNRKKVLLESRVNSSALFVKAFEECKSKPDLFIQTSAIGYYADAPFSNEQSPPGNDFLSEITIKWEKATEAIEQMDGNRVIIRTGVVLAEDSLIIKKFKLPFKLYAGGHLADGQQIMSWIHIDDLVNSIQFIIENVKKSQIFNCTAPNPVTMEEFCKKLAKKMKRPSWLHVPAFILKILFGQMAEETMLKGHKILPENLLKSGFKFKYEDITSALNSLKKL